MDIWDGDRCEGRVDDPLRWRGLIGHPRGRDRTVDLVSYETDLGAIHDVAVFDATRGTLVSYERMTLLDRGHSEVRRPPVLSYVMFLAEGDDDLVGQCADP